MYFFFHFEFGYVKNKPTEKTSGLLVALDYGMCVDPKLTTDHL